ncbi:MAG: sulfatase-like hydrolase/transferase [Defluviitaleaceae bacterium]|nr:sulfatase-like hydrolase/transferase [Defluviitaleaceae bacterium]
MNKPAIVLITCDELRRDGLSLYGNQSISTPHLDKLASASMRFDNCYTPSPLCLPARCAIATGLFPHNSGAYSNFRECPLNTGLPNIFTLLKKSGYRASMFGKCHFVPAVDERATATTTVETEYRDQYLALGIDDLYLQDDKAGSIWFYDDYSRELEAAGYLDAYRERQWNKKEYASVFDFPGPAQWHPDIRVADKTCEYLEKYDREEAPFLWLSFSGPHYPFDPPAQYLSRVDASKMNKRVYDKNEFDNPNRVHHTSYHGPAGIDACNRAKDGACKNFTEEYWERLRVAYNANIALIDDQIGRVLEVVRQKFGDNAMIIFTTDHGELLGDHGLWGKHNCVYDSVWRTPLFIQFPHGAHAGEVAEAKVNTMDLLPTILRVADIDTDVRFDGRELISHAAAGGYDYIFAEAEGLMAVTDGVYKYCYARFGDKDFHELMNLEADPNEFNNFYNDPTHNETLIRLQKQIIERLVKDVLP